MTNPHTVRPLKPAAVGLPGLTRPLTRLVLGTMTFGDTVDANEAARMLDVALDAGVTAVDTANVYAGGVTEEGLGDLLPSRRERVVLATKAGMPIPTSVHMHPCQLPACAWRSRAACAGSAWITSTSSISTSRTAAPRWPRPWARSPSSSQKGRWRRRGSPTSPLGRSRTEPLRRRGGRSSSGGRAAAVQPGRPASRGGVPGVRAGSGLFTMAYNPPGGGLPTGRHTFDRSATSGRFAEPRVAQMYKDRCWRPQLFSAVTELDSIARDAGSPLAQLALRWLLGRNEVGAVLLGGSQIEQVRTNIAAAAAGPLPVDVVASCDEVGATLRRPMPSHNR